MGNVTIPENLLQRPFFHGLASKHLQMLLSVAEPRSIDYGDYLISEGSVADEFFIVIDGQIDLEQFAGDAGAITIETVGPGSVVGWSFLVPPHFWRLSARAAAVPTNVLACDAKQLRTLLDQDAEFRYQMLRRLARVEVERLTAARQAVRITA